MEFIDWQVESKRTIFYCEALHSLDELILVVAPLNKLLNLA